MACHSFYKARDNNFRLLNHLCLKSSLRFRYVKLNFYFGGQLSTSSFNIYFKTIILHGVPAEALAKAGGESGIRTHDPVLAR